jgi:hypothetical protein
VTTTVNGIQVDDHPQADRRESSGGIGGGEGAATGPETDLSTLNPAYLQSPWFEMLFPGRERP